MSKKVKFSKTVQVLNKDDTVSIISVEEFHRQSFIERIWRRIEKYVKIFLYCLMLYGAYKMRKKCKNKM